jgi:hypothetical protein
VRALSRLSEEPLIHVARSAAWGICETPFPFNFLILYTVGGTPWTLDKPNAEPRTDIRASSGTEAHDPSV